MTLKPFTGEGRFECGLDAVVAGKVWAFVPVMPQKADVFGLGIAIANERGYNPIPLTWCWSETYAEMDTHADLLNQAEGLSNLEAAKIVASTMRREYGSD